MHDLSITTDSAAPAVHIGQLKGQLRIDTGDDDSQLQFFLDSATGQLEEYLGVSFITKTYLWVRDSFGSGRRDADDFWYSEYPSGSRQPAVLTLPRAPLLTVAYVKYYDSADTLQTWDSAEYQVDILRQPGRIRAITQWPQVGDNLSAVQISFTAGYGTAAGTVPPRIQHALSMIVGHFWSNRESTAVMSIHEVPHGWKALVDDYRTSFF